MVKRAPQIHQAQHVHPAGVGRIRFVLVKNGFAGMTGSLLTIWEPGQLEHIY
jgi:hypothetical protein